MKMPKPEYSRTQINKAGKVLCTKNPSDQGYEWAIEVLNNWRSSHAYPINTFQSTLRDKVRVIDGNALVAQRLKRAPSIVEKLRRFDKMQLARMQDIAGVRAVMGDLGKARKLDRSYEDGRLKHEFVTKKDYINSPKPSGYRGIHRVYKYKNTRATDYNGLLVEVQIRSKLQHVWATAVETAGTFLNQGLKSSQGEEQWLQFFSLTASAFAHMERTPPVPGYESLTPLATYKAVLRAKNSLNVEDQLRAYTIAYEYVETEKIRGTYHLITVDLSTKQIFLESFSKDSVDQANYSYTEVERRIDGGEPLQAVLVSAGPIGQLRRAYPNYFLDVQGFFNQLIKIEKLALGL